MCRLFGWSQFDCETQGSPAWCADCLAGVSLTVKHKEVLLGVQTVWLGSV